MGTRAALWAHLREFHPRVVITTQDTIGDLARKHAYFHHRSTSLTHFHAGSGDRPPGWHTGGDVVRIDGVRWPWSVRRY